MKFHLSISQKNPEKTFKIDKSFSTKAAISERTVAIGNAFGIGLDEEKKFAVFKDFELEIKPGQVVLISGDSGSGKSTLLRGIRDQIQDSKDALNEFSGSAITSDSVKIDGDEVLVEGVGSEISESISILSMSGLNEAYLMLRRFKELSDGQKYRFLIAKMISMPNSGVWIFDEFASILDRITAKVVSFTVQKTARKLGKTLIVATTHEDVAFDLKPDIWIRKSFGQNVRVIYCNWKRKWGEICSLLKKTKISECKAEEIEGLDQFHYRGSYGGIVRFRYKATIAGELAGCISYVFPYMSLKGRNVALPQFSGRVTSELLRKLNREVVRISRVIVTPKFRSIGLGAHLVRETMPLTKMKYVETLAVMAKYNPFFESAGMVRVQVPADEELEDEMAKLEKLGFRRELLPSKKQNLKILSRLKRREIEKVKTFILAHCIAKKFKKGNLIPRVKALEKSALAEGLQNVKSGAVYLYWSNPKIN